MGDIDHSSRTVVLAGAGGDLGSRIGRALVSQGVTVHALVRTSTPATVRNSLEADGLSPVEVDYETTASLVSACSGAVCVVSALNGLSSVILGTQGRLLDAAVAAAVPRFIPSDFSLDYTKTPPGQNRNLDLRRAFHERVDRAEIRATSVLNGAFSDLLTGQAPIVLHKVRRVLYWGDIDQPLDFTSKDDVARFTASVALDEAAPRLLRIAGDVVTPRSIAATMTSLSGKPFKPLRAGGLGRLSALIGVVQALTPRSDAVFPAWQGMQYLRDMSSGLGKLDPLDNDRYGSRAWVSARDVLAGG